MGGSARGPWRPGGRIRSARCAVSVAGHPPGDRRPSWTLRPVFRHSPARAPDGKDAGRMFTGIVEELGTVTAVTQHAAAAELTIGCSAVLEDVRHGASIS